MTFFRSRTAASLAALAALSVSATPVMARDHRDWHHRHHNDGIDGGDVLAGLLVIGGIAAIASVASSAKDKQRTERASYPARYPGGPVNDEEVDPSYRDAPARPAGEGSDYGDYGARDYPQGADRVETSGGPGGFDGAVNACTAEIERGDRRVDTVETVRSMRDRYSVEGRLADGRDFACSVDTDGHVRSVAVDGEALTS